jgi:uncharacterized small protein (DUF1192 family)
MSLAIFAMIQELKARVSGLEDEVRALKAQVKWGEVSTAPASGSDKVGEKSTLSLKKAS